MARYTVVPTLEGPGAEEESPVRGADSPAAARLLLRVTARRTRLATLYTCLWTRRTLAVLVCIGVAVAYIAVTLGTATPPVQLLVLGLPAAFTLAVANGANDIANSLGTSVGCGALTLNVALGLGSAVEFVGAVSMGASVTATISEGVVNGTKFEENPAQFSLLMLSVLMGAGASTLLATVRTMTRHCTALAACRWSASTCCGMIMVVSTAETAPPQPTRVLAPGFVPLGGLTDGPVRTRTLTPRHHLDIRPAHFGHARHHCRSGGRWDGGRGPGGYPVSEGAAMPTKSQAVTPRNLLSGRPSFNSHANRCSNPAPNSF